MTSETNATNCGDERSPKRTKMSDCIILQVPRSDRVQGHQKWKTAEKLVRKSKFFSRLLDDPTLRKKYCSVDGKGRVVIELSWLVAYFILVKRRPIPVCSASAEWMLVNRAFRDAIRAGCKKPSKKPASLLVTHFLDGLEFEN